MDYGWFSCHIVSILFAIIIIIIRNAAIDSKWSIK